MLHRGLAQELRARAMLEAKIINRGQGPEIAGTRITVVCFALTGLGRGSTTSSQGVAVG
jgi:hypothetical protein